MTRECPLRRRLVGGAVIALMVAAPLSVPIGAQTAAASKVKAAFLYNFAKFATWPDDVLAPDERLRLCVVGDADVANALEETIKGRTVEGHMLTVQIVDVDSSPRGCHLVYVDGRDAKRSVDLINAFKGQAILSVGDGERFAELGGVAQLILERDRMRFAINVSAAERARIGLSSKLLNLATIVRN